jgi:hypothetical protein
MKAADFAINLLRDKDQHINAELIALHVIRPEINDVYYTFSNVFTPGLAEQSQIIEYTKKAAQKAAS